MRGLLLHALLIGGLIVMLYPVIWMVMSSLRPENEIFGGLGLIPEDLDAGELPQGVGAFGQPDLRAVLLQFLP